MVEKSASPIPKTPEVQKSDTKQEIIDETDDEEDIPLKKIVKSKKAQSLKKSPSNANTANSASRPKRSRKVPKKLQDNSENEDAFPEYDALDFEDSPDEYVPKKTSRRSRGKSKKVQADSDESEEWKPGAEDEVEEPFERGNNCTVWKFQDFSVTQILREICFRNSGSSKLPFL